MVQHAQGEGASREVLCRLLAACYYEPSLAFTEERVFDAMHLAAAQLDPDMAPLARQMGDAFSVEEPQSLLVDYTRLFLGPVDTLAKPYGSVWLEQRTTLMQESTVELLDLYAEGGFEMDESFRDLPDHIAAQLEFLYLLIYRENEARYNGDAAALATVEDVRKRFLEGHLGQWFGEFATAMRGGSQTIFYRTLADLTEKFVRYEMGRSVTV